MNEWFNGYIIKCVLIKMQSINANTIKILNQFNIKQQHQINNYINNNNNHNSSIVSYKCDHN